MGTDTELDVTENQSETTNGANAETTTATAITADVDAAASVPEGSETTQDNSAAESDSPDEALKAALLKNQRESQINADSAPALADAPEPADTEPKIEATAAEAINTPSTSAEETASPTELALAAELITPLQAVLSDLTQLSAKHGTVDEAKAKTLRKSITDFKAKPDDCDADELAQALALNEQISQRVRNQVEQREQHYNSVLQQLDRLELAVTANQLQDAEKAEKSIVKLLKKMQGLSEQRWQSINKRLNTTRPKLKTLESWRHWGTSQARDELINKINLLVGSRLGPEDLAKTIQDARDQWRAWDLAGDHSPKSLWDKFDKACEKAYEPCIEFFDNLKVERQSNYKQRKALTDNLAALYKATDWETPDWRDLDKRVRAVRREFYKVGNVDYKHRKPLAKALEQAEALFQPHFDEERDHNIKLREDLIVKTIALGELENGYQAVLQLETLKKQWQPTVLSKRGIENAIWKQFQAACDHVYTRRNEQRKEAMSARDENLKLKNVLTDQLEAAAKLSDEELLAQKSLDRTLKQEWDEIGEVPRKIEKKLFTRWREAQSEYATAVRKAKAKLANVVWAQRQQAAALCQELELAVYRSVDINAADWQSKWDALTLKEDAPAKKLNSRFAKALQANDAQSLFAQADKNTKTQLERCLKLELAMEIDSPAEFQKQRMALQIARLSAAMKKNTQGIESNEELLQDLFATGPVTEAASESLATRINLCFQHYCANDLN